MTSIAMAAFDGVLGIPVLYIIRAAYYNTYPTGGPGVEGWDILGRLLFLFSHICARYPISGDHGTWSIGMGFMFVVRVM